MNGLISYLPESEIALARFDLFSPTTGGSRPPAPRSVRLCLHAASLSVIYYSTHIEFVIYL